MQRDAADDERDVRDLGGARDLREHDDPDDGRDRGQQRDHQRVGRARQARHRELVGDVGNDR